MVLKDRVLLRVGPDSRGFCEGPPSAECPTVMAKMLSGYGFLRGSARGLFTLEPKRDAPLSGLGMLHLDGVSAALPGGDMFALSVDAVLSGSSRFDRVRITLIDLENVFGCRDMQSGSWMFPFLGMASNECRPDSVFGLDARALRFQWDAWDQHLLAEWFHAGPAFELLQNGLSQAHLKRSITVAALADVQTRYAPQASHSSGTDLGAGVRLSALYRTPFLESRLRVTQRSVLVGGAGAGHDHRVESELRLVHNWLLSDAILMQTGFSFAFSWASRPWLSDALIASRTAPVTLAAGLYVGWVSESPGI